MSKNIIFLNTKRFLENIWDSLDYSESYLSNLKNNYTIKKKKVPIRIPLKYQSNRIIHKYTWKWKETVGWLINFYFDYKFEIILRFLNKNTVIGLRKYDFSWIFRYGTFFEFYEWIIFKLQQNFANFTNLSIYLQSFKYIHNIRKFSHEIQVMAVW